MKNVKTLIAAALVFTTVFSVGITPSYAAASQTNIAQQGSVQAKGDTARVQLKGNPTTGYEWQYEIKDTSIAKVINGNYVFDDKTGQLDGAGGTYTWSFIGLKKGTTEVTFKYLRPWESEVLKTVTYVINVDSDLNVTVTEKKDVQSVMGSISLHGNMTTGYEWQYNVKDANIADVVDEKIDADDKTGELDGSGETHAWKIKGLKEGETEITFNYLRPWEEEVEQSITYTIKVDSGLNVTVEDNITETEDSSGVADNPGNAVQGVDNSNNEGTTAAVTDDTRTTTADADSTVKDDSDINGVLYIWSSDGIDQEKILKKI